MAAGSSCGANALVDETPRDLRPSYYAARPGKWRDMWSVLHPPYTAWHLSYVVIGASLAPHLHVMRLVETLCAFFLAVGIAAHVLDELRGRPLRTEIRSSTLVALAIIGLLGALGIGIYGITQVGWVLLPFMVVGPVLVVAYNFEVFGGALHNAATFAFAWGAFPVLTAYVAQSGRVSVGSFLAAGAAFLFSIAQRTLSMPARLIRRRATAIGGSVTLSSGKSIALDAAALLDPLEEALRAMSWAMVLLATSLAIARLA